jgi:hypothetical protein
MRAISDAAHLTVATSLCRTLSAMLVIALSACFPPKVKPQPDSAPVQLRLVTELEADSIVRAVRRLWASKNARDSLAVRRLTISETVLNIFREEWEESREDPVPPDSLTLTSARRDVPGGDNVFAQFVLPIAACPSGSSSKERLRVGFVLRPSFGWRVEGLYSPNSECSSPRRGLLRAGLAHEAVFRAVPDTRRFTNRHSGPQG